MYGAARLNDMRDCMHMQFAVYTVYGLNMYYKVTIQVKYKKKIQTHNWASKVNVRFVAANNNIKKYNTRTNFLFQDCIT